MNDKKPISERSIKVCQLISRGYSVQKACAELHFGTDDFYDEMRVNEALGLDYSRARECRSDVRFEELQSKIDRLESGELPPEVARVAIAATQWQMGKEKSKIYGERQVHQHEGNITLSALVESSLSPAALPAPKDDIIDITPISKDVKDFI